MNNLKDLEFEPVVFAVGNRYCISVWLKSAALVNVTIGEKIFYDSSNGVMCSNKKVHKVYVTMELLDKAKEYKVCYKKIIDRKPYFTKTDEEVSLSFIFKPVTDERKINIYQIADAHGNFEKTYAAASFYGDLLDAVILNGDIPNHSGDIENYKLIYKLCGALTRGEKPCIFARGNHDMRGACAEQICDYIPEENGKLYYTFRLGSIWGIILDCGEDKDDFNEEYGNTVCCHAFREEQTEYLKYITDNSEYNAEGIRHKIVISHIPFSYSLKAPFNIEHDIYTEWLKILSEKVKPNIMLCGHLHKLAFSPVGSEMDMLGQACPVVIGSKPIFDRTIEDKPMIGYIGCAITFDEDSINVKFTDNDKNVISENIIEK